jgi:glycosyltransferase involved in cell wall biosynthesis
VLFLDDGGQGMSHYAQNLARGLEPNCHVALHKICVDEATSTTSMWDRLLDSSRVIRQIRRYYNPSRMRRVARAIQTQHQPTIVHLTSSIPCMYALVNEFKRGGVTVVYTVHDPAPHNETRTTWGEIHSRLNRKWLLPRTLLLLDSVHVHSALHVQELQQQYRRLDVTKVYVVQHGGGVTAEIESGSDVPVELHPLESSRRCILFFGRIEPYKGLHVLFSAIELLATKYPDLALLVAGGGQLPSMPDNIRANVVLINRFVRDAEIKAIASRAMCIVLPYLEATQTGVIPLASSFSLPAVATRVGALADLVIDEVTGTLVEANDARALADAIEAMIADPEKTRLMGQSAREHMNNNFGWPIVARLHHQRYTFLLARQGKANES